MPMLAISLLPIIVSFAIGLLIISVAWPGHISFGAVLLMRMSLAFGLGIGVSSSLYFVWLAIVGPDVGGFSAVEIVILCALMMFLYRGRFQKIENFDADRPPPAAHSKIYRAITIAFSALLAIVVALEFWLVVLAPHGAWDAWAIWNLH